MDFRVILTRSAAKDLEDIYSWVNKNDGSANARKLLDNIESILDRLSKSPHRRVYPGELIELGIKQYRELFFKPYRIIYQVANDIVYVMLIADGRRDFQQLLQRRLLEN